MSLDVSALSAYVDETSSALVKKAVLKGNTPSVVSLMAGIKSTKTINKLASSLSLQAGACGFSNAGTTALTQMPLDVEQIKLNESICLTTLEDYYTQVMLRAGSYNENMPFEQIFAEEKATAISNANDLIIWQGNKVAGVGNLALANGLLYKLDNDALYASAQTPANVVLTAANAIATVDALVALIPAAIAGEQDLTLFLSPVEYQFYMLGLRAGNYFHYASDYDFANGVIHPGSSVRVRPVAGLTGLTRKLLTPASNVYVGTDLMEDAEQFKIFYSQDNDEVRVIAKYKLGAAIAFPEFAIVTV